MDIRREGPVEGRLLDLIREHPGSRAGADPDARVVPDAELTGRAALALFEAALQSRLQDLEARRLKDRGESFYTIGSSGHEANAVFGWLLRTTDPAFLHYRSGAFMAARARRGTGETPLFDAMLAFAASADDPVSGGRHKVFGSKSLHVPPQTSTIASHLPKAVGCAYALARMQRLGVPAHVPYDSLVYCSFGDASVNHATAQAGLNAAAAATLHNQPCPILFVCEDNGIGISVRTPEDYIERLSTNMTSARACDYVRCRPRCGHAFASTTQAGWPLSRPLPPHASRPVFFHLKTVRL